MQNKPKKSLTEIYKDLPSTKKNWRDHGETAWLTEDGKFHRIGGPADEFDNGDKIFYVNGKRHNEEGAAIQLANGQNFFYLEGVEMTKKQWATEVKKYAPKAPKAQAG